MPSVASFYAWSEPSGYGARAAPGALPAHPCAAALAARSRGRRRAGCYCEL